MHLHCTALVLCCVGVHCVKQAFYNALQLSRNLWKTLGAGGACLASRAGPGFYYLSLSLPSLLDLKVSSIFYAIPADTHTHTRSHFLCFCSPSDPHSLPSPPPAISSLSLLPGEQRMRSKVGQKLTYKNLAEIDKKRRQIFNVLFPSLNVILLS